MQNKIVKGFVPLIRTCFKSNLVKNVFGCVSVRQISTTKFCSSTPINPYDDIFRTNPGIEKYMRLRDSIPDNYKLIYKHIEYLSYAGMLMILRVFLVFSVVGVGYMYVHGFVEEFEFLDTTIKNYDKWMYFFIAIWFPLVYMLILMLSKTVLRIYYHAPSRSYKIITPANAPLQHPKCTDFSHTGKSLIDKKSLATKYELVTKINVAEKSFYVFEDDFRSTIDYHNLVDGDDHVYR